VSFSFFVFIVFNRISQNFPSFSLFVSPDRQSPRAGHCATLAYAQRTQRLSVSGGRYDNKAWDPRHSTERHKRRHAAVPMLSMYLEPARSMTEPTPLTP